MAGDISTGFDSAFSFVTDFFFGAVSILLALGRNFDLDALIIFALIAGLTLDGVAGGDCHAVSVEALLSSEALDEGAGAWAEIVALVGGIVATDLTGECKVLPDIVGGESAVLGHGPGVINCRWTIIIDGIEAGLCAPPKG